jgi:hypothetical protein
MLTKTEAKREGKRAGEAAASWFDPGDRRNARRLLEMLDDGDPRLDEYLPRSPDLSGEYAGESMNEILDIDDDDDDDDVDEIAQIWEDAASTAFMRSIEKQIRSAAR